MKIGLPNAVTIGEAVDAMRSIRFTEDTYLVIDNFQFLHIAEIAKDIACNCPADIKKKYILSMLRIAWALYMSGDINKTQGIARLTTKYPGRYAVLKNANYKSFADMPGRWSEVYVNGLGSAELVNGMYENNSLVFKPGKNTTRGEFVKMLVAAKGLHIGDIDVSMFADSKKFADWQIPYAAAAAKAGWLKGAKISNGVEARLNDLITREDAMVLVYRAFFAPNIAQKPNSFLDSKDVAAYAKNEVEYLTSIGVVNGYLDNTLKPKNLIAREEAAKIIYECILISDAFGAK